jgi:hypothetical protein
MGVGRAVICDFCSSPDVRWRYEAHSFVAAVELGFTHESVGAWAACDPCRGLIERRDREGLTARSFEALRYQHPELEILPEERLLDLKNYLKEIHEMFFRHKLTGCSRHAA